MNRKYKRKLDKLIELDKRKVDKRMGVELIGGAPLLKPDYILMVMAGGMQTIIGVKDDRHRFAATNGYIEDIKTKGYITVTDVEHDTAITIFIPSTIPATIHLWTVEAFEKMKREQKYAAMMGHK